MSDCFNHEADAWDSIMFGCEGNDPSAFYSDPLYYHQRLPFKEIKVETPKAFLLVLNTGQELWIPKKICRHLSTKSKDVMVHTKTFLKILDESRNS